MANNPHWYDAAVDAAAALADSGYIKVYTGAQPAEDAALTGTLLVTLTFGSTAFGSSASGSADANSITAGTAVASGTAGYFALLKSDGTTVIATGSVGTTGADLNLDTLSIVSGTLVSCSSFTIAG